MTRLFCAACCVLLFSSSSATAGRRNLVTDPLDGGLSGHVQLDYDGAREDGGDFRLAAEAELGDWTRWLRLTVDTYGSPGSSWAAEEDTFAAVEAGHALWRDHEHRFYVNAVLQMDAPSLLSARGVDFSPQLSVVHGLSPHWWIGAEAGGALATSPEEGYRRGYPFANFWIVWLPGGSADSGNSSDDGEDSTAGEEELENDDVEDAEEETPQQSITLNLWIAGSDDPDAGTESALSLEYRRDLSESVEVILGVEALLSGEEGSGLAASAGLRWNF